MLHEKLGKSKMLNVSKATLNFKGGCVWPGRLMLLTVPCTVLVARSG